MISADWICRLPWTVWSFLIILLLIHEHSISFHFACIIFSFFVNVWYFYFSRFIPRLFLSNFWCNYKWDCFNKFFSDSKLIYKNTSEENKMAERVDMYIFLNGYIRSTPSATEVCRTPAESGEEYLTSRKECIKPYKTWLSGVFTLLFFSPFFFNSFNS